MKQLLKESFTYLLTMFGLWALLFLPFAVLALVFVLCNMITAAAGTVIVGFVWSVGGTVFFSDHTRR